MFTSCVTNSNPDSLSSSETGVYPGKELKKHLSDWARCQKAIGGIYFTKKWRSETIQPGLEFDNFKPPFKRGIFNCIFSLNSFFFFFGVMIGFSERGSQRPIQWHQRRLLACQLISCLYIYSLYNGQTWIPSFGNHPRWSLHSQQII